MCICGFSFVIGSVVRCVVFFMICLVFFIVRFIIICVYMVWLCWLSCLNLCVVVRLELCIVLNLNFMKVISVCSSSSFGCVVSCVGGNSVSRWFRLLMLLKVIRDWFCVFMWWVVLF